MAKKPKPAIRSVRQKAEKANANPFINVVNKAMNIIGMPALALGAAGWIYHSIEDTKTAVQTLDGNVAKLTQHVEDRDGAQDHDINGLVQWLTGLSAKVDRLFGGGGK